MCKRQVVQMLYCSLRKYEYRGKEQDKSLYLK
jgi:hypothetical protein